MCKVKTDKPYQASFDLGTFLLPSPLLYHFTLLYVLEGLVLACKDDLLFDSLSVIQDMNFFPLECPSILSFFLDI